MNDSQSQININLQPDELKKESDGEPTNDHKVGYQTPDLGQR